MTPPDAQPANSIDALNVVWDSPSVNSAGSMPIGNGEVGLNVWAEEGGDLVLLISRTDAFSEACRLLKLGRVRVRIEPNPFRKGLRFNQRLRMSQGRIEIEAGEVRLDVFVYPDRPVIYVAASSAAPVRVEVIGETWRTERRRLEGEELKSSWTMQNAPMEVWESADVVAPEQGAVSWFHRNESSIVPLTLKHQGIESLARWVKDPLIERTFGVRIEAAGFSASGPLTLASAGPIKKFEAKIAATCRQAESTEAWARDARQVLRSAPSGERSASETARWWREFWQRSWILVGGDESAERVTRAYALQRWMTACGGRGEYPIKFNGSIFTVEPEFTGGPKLNPDWRRWGDCYWWQNTRLPVAPLAASGDYEMMDPLFRLYERNLDVCRERAALYYESEGAYFPETMTIFGTYANQDYGWDRTGRRANEVLCPWWQWAWQQGLELVSLMLDRYEHTEDREFLERRLLPMAREVLRYYDDRFARDSRGRMRISPTQAAETYWHDVVNDTPSVAGLHAVTERLARVSGLSAQDRDLIARLRGAAPKIPIRKTKDGQVVIAPAEEYRDQRSNVENPEFYAIWPFRVFGVGRPSLDVGARTFHSRIERSNLGWQYDGQVAAILGLAEEAKASLLAKVANSHPNHRFPVMWGPNYDWLPDQCHGGNIMLTLQNMVLQSDGDAIYVLPAWPKAWDVEFRLHAPKRTTVNVAYRGGKLTRLDVRPAARLKDVVLPEGMTRL